MTLAPSAVHVTDAPADYLVLAKPAGPRCNLRCAYCYYLPKAELFPSDAGLSHLKRE